MMLLEAQLDQNSCEYLEIRLRSLSVGYISVDGGFVVTWHSQNQDGGGGSMFGSRFTMPQAMHRIRISG